MGGTGLTEREGGRLVQRVSARLCLEGPSASTALEGQFSGPGRTMLKPNGAGGRLLGVGSGGQSLP